MHQARPAAPSTPRYLVLAETLRAQIMAGDPPVGELLPTEHALCDRFEVSRHTVREALRLLAEAGLIARRRGAGTVVIASQPRTVYIQRLGGLEDILQYPRDSRMEPVEHDVTTPSAAVAERLGLPPGLKYFRVRTIRRRPLGPPIALSDVYIRADIAPDVQAFVDLQISVADWVFNEHGVPLARVDQTVTAEALSAHDAGLLDAPEGGAGLRVMRRFMDEHNQVFGASEVIHPAGRFRIDMTMCQEQARPAPAR